MFLNQITKQAQFNKGMFLRRKADHALSHLKHMQIKYFKSIPCKVIRLEEQNALDNF